MKTWNDYKRHVKTVDPTSGKDISNIEEQVAIISEIVKARKELGLSQRELAIQCNIPQSSIARIESYSSTPRLDTLIKIARPLGLKITLVK